MTKAELMGIMIDRVIAKNNARKNPLPFSRMDIQNIAVQAACVWVTGGSDRKVTKAINDMFKMCEANV